MKREPVGVLLAAGIGRRFDPTGASLKLLEVTRQGARSGLPLAHAAAQPFVETLHTVIAVVGPHERPHQRELHALLRSSGCRVVVCDDPERGIGRSIARGVAQTPDANGWLIALADMPAIHADTVDQVRRAIEAGHASVVPTFNDQRGHPVGFGRECRDDLLALDGDVGARSVLERFPPHRIAVEDPGILIDIDTPES